MSDSTLNSQLQLLRPIFQAHCDERHLPGCAYGVVAGDQLAISGSIGAVNPITGIAPDATTVYRIASMTKSFAALAILMLRDEGKLSLDAAAADYVTECATWLTQRRQRAHHRTPLVDDVSGMAGGQPMGRSPLWRDNAQLAEILLPGVSFANAPAVTFEYSNLGYMVLGIIANVSGESSLDFITRRILQPLGMHDTVWNAEDVEPGLLAKGYHWLDGGWAEEPMLPSGGDAAVLVVSTAL